VANVLVVFLWVFNMARHRLGEWRQLLQDALSESNPETLPQKIAFADMAVWQRMEQIKGKAGAETAAERNALGDAVRSLANLKKRHFPGWVKRKG
jgi:hypothetical protein